MEAGTRGERHAAERMEEGSGGETEALLSTSGRQREEEEEVEERREQKGVRHKLRSRSESGEGGSGLGCCNWLLWCYEEGCSRDKAEASLRALLQRVVPVRDEEIPVVLRAFFGFFFLLAAYFLCQPLRDEAGMSLGTGALPGLFVASLIATILAAPLSSALLSRTDISKGQALLLLYRFFSLCLVAFFFFYGAVPPPQGQRPAGMRVGDVANLAFIADVSIPFLAVRASLFLFVALLNLFAMAAMWARLADVMTSEAGARLFGFVGAGATFGQLAGSLLASLLAPIGPAILLFAAALMEMAAQCAMKIGALSSSPLPSSSSSPDAASGTVFITTPTSSLDLPSLLKDSNSPSASSVPSSLPHSPPLCIPSHPSSLPTPHHSHLTPATPLLHFHQQSDSSPASSPSQSSPLAPTPAHGTISSLPPTTAASSYPPLPTSLPSSTPNLCSPPLPAGNERYSPERVKSPSFAAADITRRGPAGLEGPAQVELPERDKTRCLSPDDASWQQDHTGKPGMQGSAAAAAAAWARPWAEWPLVAFHRSPSSGGVCLSSPSKLRRPLTLLTWVKQLQQSWQWRLPPAAAAAACICSGGSKGGVEEQCWQHSGQREKKEEVRGKGKRGATSVLDGLRLVLSSSYLLHVCCFLLLTAIVSSFFYFERSAVVAHSEQDPVKRRRLVANINSLSALATVIFQLTLTGRLLSSMGVAVALCASPLAALLGLMAIAMHPTPIVVATAEASRKVLNYVLTRPGREILFTVVSRDEKYKAKVFIDTVVQRLGDAAAAGVFRLLGGVLLLGPAGVAAYTMPLCVAWCLVAFSLGLRQQALAKSMPGGLARAL